MQGLTFEEEGLEKGLSQTLWRWYFGAVLCINFPGDYDAYQSWRTSEINEGRKTDFRKRGGTS